MKYISLSLAALLCSTAPVLAETATQPTQQEQIKEDNLPNNGEFVRFVRDQYKAGKYQEFLQNMDEDYSQAKKDGGLDGLIAMRKEDALIAAEHSSTAERWKQMAKNWAEERNKELLKLIDSSDNSPLAQKIHSVAMETDVSSEKTLAYFLHLRELSPGEGQNEDENFLIEQDLALEYKQIHLDSLSSLERWTPAAQEKRLALRLDSMEKTLVASQQFKDQELRKKVVSLAAMLDSYYVKQMDAVDLHRLAMGTIVPTNDLEKQAAAILSAYEGKFSDLSKEILQQTQDKSLE
ncbi:MAG: hypothetical protein K2X08_07630 [Chlamydiales bacterium]|nr:hypothetical protein [Chlamydiales bacterium]